VGGGGHLAGPWGSSDHERYRVGSIWVFWSGDNRHLDAWYINLQEPFRRTPEGIETQDLELDFVVSPDGSWQKKDDEMLDTWVKKGRWSADEVARIRADRIAGRDGITRWSPHVG
jgi:Protein of unknown function (DUF402)